MSSVYYSALKKLASNAKNITFKPANKTNYEHEIFQTLWNVKYT